MLASSFERNKKIRLVNEWRGTWEDGQIYDRANIAKCSLQTADVSTSVFIMQFFQLFYLLEIFHIIILGVNQKGTHLLWCVSFSFALY